MTTQKIKPVGHRILVKMVESQERVQNGIIVPETMMNGKPVTATVLDVGGGYVGENGNIPLPVSLNIGDVVLLGKNAGIEIKHEGEKLHLVTPEDILAIVY